MGKQESAPYSVPQPSQINLGLLVPVAVLQREPEELASYDHYSEGYRCQAGQNSEKAWNICNMRVKFVIQG
jgi:hypothetical protein